MVNNSDCSSTSKSFIWSVHWTHQCKLNSLWASSGKHSRVPKPFTAEVILQKNLLAILFSAFRGHSNDLGNKLLELILAWISLHSKSHFSKQTQSYILCVLVLLFWIGILCNNSRCAGTIHGIIPINRDEVTVVIYLFYAST